MKGDSKVKSDNNNLGSRNLCTRARVLYGTELGYTGLAALVCISLPVL